MTARNLFHRLGDAFERARARFRFALDAWSGRMPLPTPLERSIVMSILARLAALEAAAAAQAENNAQLAAAASAVQQTTDGLNALADRLDRIENTDLEQVATRIKAIESEIGSEPTAPVADPAPEAPIPDLNPNAR